MLFYIFADYAYLCGQQLKSVTQPTAPYSITKTKQPAIIVLPGLFETWHIFKPLTDKISQMGYDIHIIPQLQRNTKPIAELAKIVDDYINHYHLQQVIVVAHSKGCLVGKQLLINHAGDQQIKKVIALCGPFNGSRISRLINNQFSREMAIDSAAIHSLQQQNQVNCRIVSIYPIRDNHIWHPQKSYLPGATNIQANSSGHHCILADPQVNRIVIDQITNSITSTTTNNNIL